MAGLKKMWGVLILVLALGLGTGCKLDTSPENDVYSYNVDEIAGGLFGSLSPTMTMNEWYEATQWWTSTPETYDSWTKRENVCLYKDKALSTPFTSSDVLNENTEVHCDFSFNGKGKKIGEITGTITLDNIPHPATKVDIYCFSYDGPWENWWSLYKRINMSNVTGTSATLNWSLPVYESFTPNSQATFRLFFLPGDSLSAYEVSVSTGKTINNVNANVGDLGPVSIGGVTLSGTISVTHNGQPVPYVEIFATDDGNALLGITCLSSPDPSDAAWSVTFGRVNSNKTVTFQVFGYLEKNGTKIVDRYATTNSPVRIINNQSVSGIVLNVGDN
jgi:hypothetical protein